MAVVEVPPTSVVGYEYAGKPLPTFVGEPIGLADRDDTSYLPCPDAGTPNPTFRADFPAVVAGQPLVLLTRTARVSSGLKYIQIALADDPWFFTPGDGSGGSLSSHDLPEGVGWREASGAVFSVSAGYYDTGVLTPAGPFSMWMTMEGGTGSLNLSYIALLADLGTVITGATDNVRRRFI